MTEFKRGDEVYFIDQHESPVKGKIQLQKSLGFYQIIVGMSVVMVGDGEIFRTKQEAKEYYEEVLEEKFMEFKRSLERL